MVVFTGLDITFLQKGFDDILDLAIRKAQDAPAKTPSAEAMPLDGRFNATRIVPEKYLLFHDYY